MPSRKRGWKSRKPPTDPQTSSSKPSTAIVPARTDRQGLSAEVASSAGLESELGQLTLPARLDIAQAQIVVSDVGRKGHNYEGPIVKDNAKAHFGDVHNVFNFNQPSANEPVDSEESVKLMKALSFDGMSDRLMSIAPACAETCNWILNQPEYLGWQDSERRFANHGVLWIKGKAGTGKSTLMSYLYDYDHQNHCGGVTMSFFFNARSHDTLVKSTEGMYRSLLHQILWRLPRLKIILSHVQVPGSKEETWPIERLEHAFRVVVLGLSTDERVTCFVDALDECKIEDVRRAIERFEELSESVTSKNIQFRICFSSRYYPQITMRRHEELKLDVQLEHMNDISRYIDNKLTIREGAKLELSPKIYTRCSGVFLWVVLVVKRLRESSDTGSTRSQLLAILDSIPDELEELFAAVVVEPDKALISIVQWLLFAEQTLKIEELYFAVQTSVGGATSMYWDADEIDRNSMILYLLNASRGLIEFTSSWAQDRPGFIHESVREYFLSRGLARMDHTSPQKTHAAAHAKLAEGCMSYLELAVNQSTFPDLCESQGPLVWYASSYVIRHTDIALVNGTLGHHVLERISLRRAIELFRHKFPGRGYRRQTKRPLPLLYRLLQSDHYGLAEALLAQPSNQVRCTVAQCSQTNAPCTHINLNKPDLKVACDEMGLMISRGSKVIVELLLFHGADANMEARHWSALICFAVSEDQCDIVKSLLSYGARIDTAGTRDILHIAVKFAGKQMVQHLLDAGVDVNGVDDSFQTALHLTAGKQSKANDDTAAVAEILIRAGADVEAIDRDGKTVLIRAARARRTNLVQVLLRNGANVHARDHCHLTAWHAAMDPALDRHKFWCPMWSASQLHPTLQALLDAGAEIDAENHLQWTPLFTACVLRNHKLANLLNERGAVLDARHGSQVGWLDELCSSDLLEATHDGRKQTCESQPDSPISETWSTDAQY